MENETMEPSLSMNMNRQEAIAFQVLMSRTSGLLNFRKFMGPLLLLLGVAPLVMMVQIYREEQIIDWILLLTALFPFFMAGVVIFVLPWRIRRHAGKAYDATVKSGVSYYGVLTLRENALEKKTQDRTVVIPFNQDAVFIEEKTMLVLASRTQPAIIMPARCMTAEMATAVRTAAQKLSPKNYRFYGRIQPKGEPVSPPGVSEREILWEKQFRYTPAEYADVARASTWQSFWKRLPYLTFMSVIISLTLWTGESLWTCIAPFLAAMAILSVTSLLVPLSRVRRVAMLDDSQMPSMSIILTNLGIQVEVANKGAVIPWCDVRHVIDRGNSVELQWNTAGDGSCRIPRRCIEDFAAFDQLITTYWSNRK